MDFTYVPTWSGMAFTAFVFDACSQRIVGWRTAAAMPTQLPLDALEMALWNRGRAGQDVTGVVHTATPGSTPPSATPTGCSRPAPSHRSGPSATATTASIVVSPRRGSDPCYDRPRGCLRVDLSALVAATFRPLVGRAVT
ncbi:MAG: hypothetical protein H0V10_11590 [Geodermatophilaceae bacterium]|nr:hypothetical protein [Geodermatophilaceae bacterium]